MDPKYKDKKIIELTEEEVKSLAFLGPNVVRGVRTFVDAARADPGGLGSITCSSLDSMNRKYAAPAAPQDAPVSPTVSDADTLFSQLSNDPSALTIVAPDLVSKFESNFWYHGISGDPPNLLWRSDLENNPFRHPTPGDRFFKILTKTAHGVYGTPLNEVWDDVVAPKIVTSMKNHGIKYSALKPARFSTHEEGEDEEDETFGPVVVWIAVWPGTTKAEAVRDATPDILSILADANIHDVVVEWYEGSVKLL
ncbi:hypothetical protein CC1G_08118 [Coprinopsis cinerea okayama7|uniref:Uncharacterized protein n=1 Tax=Coprinopsis cinerea (strain Okayama-7 / 130 / ATCC MYA-4618 / FGSC 9003) TaxID=240176 RepID=A8NVK2_COPC7|nr:hypothetical protein CC1G_08118 [Coprinopsis cinerea okayama7\|eukprot:XP_001836733.1 hypothetical protein CC1G_08118 [Coprinopsis cinerea okayama7\